MPFLRQSIRAIALIAPAMVASSFASAQVNIPAASRAGDVPAFSGAGLPALGWVSDQGTADAAEAYALITAPSFSFQSTRINYPNGTAGAFGDDGNTVASFLGSDAPSLSGFGDNPIDGTFYRFSGFIAITDVSAPITFGVYSDDGFRLRIGGVIVTDQNNPRSPELSSAQASFEQPGLYPIDLLYFETAGGQAGVNLLSSLAGAVQLNGLPDLSIVEPARLYAIPTPGTVGLALLGALLATHRKR